VTEIEMQKAEAQAPPALIEAQAPPALIEAQAPPAPESRPAAREPSGVHRRPALPVDVPAHREELLARLRQRATKVDIDSIAARTTDKTG
jgi:hypothetical protein